jgi:hypothetical protein
VERPARSERCHEGQGQTPVLRASAWVDVFLCAERVTLFPQGDRVLEPLFSSPRKIPAPQPVWRVDGESRGPYLFQVIWR